MKLKLLLVCSLIVASATAQEMPQYEYKYKMPAVTDNVAILYAKDYVAFRWNGDTLDSSHFRAFFEFMGEDSSYANLLCFYSIQYLYQHETGVDSLDLIMRTSFFWGLNEYACFSRLQNLKVTIVKNEVHPDFRPDPAILFASLQRRRAARHVLRRKANRRRLATNHAPILVALVF